MSEREELEVLEALVEVTARLLDVARILKFLFWAVLLSLGLDAVLFGQALGWWL